MWGWIKEGVIANKPILLLRLSKEHVKVKKEDTWNGSDGENLNMPPCLIFGFIVESVRK